STGFIEFGLVCGVGLIVIMISTLITMPTMIMVRQRYREFRGKEIKKTKDISYGPVGRIGQTVYDHWKVSLAGMLIVTGFFGIMASRLTMDYNYLNMEPEGLESIELGDKIIEKYNFSPDVTMMTAKSLEENQRFTAEAKEKAHVSYVESITDYLPEPDEQKRRSPAIQEIAASMAGSRSVSSITTPDWQSFKTELERLEMNVIEMQEMAFMGGQDNVDAKATRLVGNPDKPEQTGNLSDLIALLDENAVPLDRVSEYNRDFGQAFKNIVLDMADTSTITLDMIPDLIRNKHVSDDGSRFLLTVYPKGNVWHIDYLEAFAEEMLDITPAIAGTPPMFYFLLEILGEDGKRASLLTILVVLLLLWADFRSLKHAFLAMVPLVFGVVWMVGIMGLTGIQITLLNIMAIPLIIGIGIDDGVHLLHRYRIEGLGALNTVYRSTGKAIIITSLTTMLAFGSLVFATYRGFGSM
ncbi:MAG: MMPL family transporter, partial [Candidatus Marinimicrobia bacterium]|nr:MMPL family transporter [Candidatus Neomarinimicrobiota bacterium]